MWLLSSEITSTATALHTDDEIMRRGAGSLKKYALSAFSAGPSKPGCIVKTSTGHNLATDLPKPAGGADEAAQPVELMLAALLGCKTATAHFVARHLWARPHNKIAFITFEDVVAERDERGALTLPITDELPITAALTRVTGIARVRPVDAASISAASVEKLGELVEQRCPVAATLVAAGTKLEFEWLLDDSS